MSKLESTTLHLAKTLHHISYIFILIHRCWYNKEEYENRKGNWSLTEKRLLGKREDMGIVVMEEED